MQKKYFAIFNLSFLLFIMSSLSYGNAQVLSKNKILFSPPRLWKAEKKGDNESITTLYFLAATHLGLPIEYDRYFSRVVLPVFADADILLYEGVAGREWEPKPLCDPTILGPNDLALLAKMRQEAEHAYVSAQEIIHTEQVRAGIDDKTTAAERRIAAHTYVSSLDEFELRDIYLLYTQVNLDAAVTAAPGVQSQFSRNNVAEELRLSRPNIPVRDVDSLYGARRAYCAAGPERIQLLRSSMSSTNSMSVDYMDQIPELEQEFIDILSRKELASNSIFMKLNALDRSFLCGRNVEWERDMIKLNDGKVHFYVLGARHFFPVDHDGAHCGGLLADLRKAGMTLRAIE